MRFCGTRYATSVTGKTSDVDESSDTPNASIVLPASTSPVTGGQYDSQNRMVPQSQSFQYLRMGAEQVAMANNFGSTAFKIVRAKYSLTENFQEISVW